nr:hypothetical protein [Streptomyces diacarni]
MGERAQDRRSGKTGRVIQVTGPAPFIYRLLLDEGAPPIVVYRYGDQLRRVPATSVAGTGTEGVDDEVEQGSDPVRCAARGGGEEEAEQEGEDVVRVDVTTE